MIHPARQGHQDEAERIQHFRDVVPPLSPVRFFSDQPISIHADPVSVPYEVRQTYRSGWHKRAVQLMAEPVDVLRVQDVGLPDNAHEANERNLLVRDAVSRLALMYRSVVELCDLECVPMKEAARRLR